MRVRQARRDLDRAQQMLNGFFRLAELLENASQVEFGQCVFRFKLHGDHKFLARFLHASQLIKSRPEIDVRLDPFGRGIDRLAVGLRGLFERFGLESHAMPSSNHSSADRDAMAWIFLASSEVSKFSTNCPVSGS